MTIMEQVGAEIRRVREEKGWTQIKLGKVLGYSQGQVSLIESGQEGMTLERLAWIAGRLGCRLVVKFRRGNG